MTSPQHPAPRHSLGRTGVREKSESPAGIIELLDPPATCGRIRIIDGQDPTIDASGTATQTCELRTNWGTATQIIRCESPEREHREGLQG
jgi:hypothetical protein